MATLTTFALVGTAAAALASVGSALVSAKQQSNVAKFNEKLSQQNAMTMRQQAAADEEAFRRRGERMKSSQRAAIGASGITLEGSPLDVMADTEVELEKEALNIRYAGEIGGRRYDNEASGFAFRARSAEMGGYIGAGTALLMGADSLSKRRLGSADNAAPDWGQREFGR